MGVDSSSSSSGLELIARTLVQGVRAIDDEGPVALGVALHEEHERVRHVEYEHVPMAASMIDKGNRNRNDDDAGEISHDNLNSR